MHRCAVMKLNRTTYALSLATVGLLMFACDNAKKGSASMGTPEMQAGGTVAQKKADGAIVDRLAAARCDQEAGCKNVGPGAKYDSRKVCLDTLRGSIGNELNTYNCPRGLDTDGIGRCMSAIAGEECSHPFETLTRFDKCRTSAVCMK
jgi:hypothetical protein